MGHVPFIVTLSKGYASMSRHMEMGRIGEELACREIEKMGYRILERNYRSKLGEIDLIAMDGNVLVFIEVKTRSSSIDYAKEAIDAKKMKRLSMLALSYIKKKRYENMRARFDIVAICIKEGKPQQIELIRDAFWCKT